VGAWRWRSTSRRSSASCRIFTEAAELVKILEKHVSQRDIGLVNEMAIVCDKLGVDVWEVIEAAATKPFGFMKSRRAPASGGTVSRSIRIIFAWKMRTLNYRTRIHRAGRRDQRRDAEYWVARVGRPPQRAGAGRARQQGAVVGVAYKQDIGDIRESPALDVIRLLQRRGAAVSYHDPHVAKSRMSHRSRVGPAYARNARRRGLV